MGDKFLDELSQYYEAIMENQFAFGWLDSHHRRALLKRYPFAIIYEVFAGEIIINAVLHTRRSHDLR